AAYSKSVPCHVRTNRNREREYNHVNNYSGSQHNIGDPSVLKPTMDVEESGDLTSDQVDDVIAHVKRIDYSAKGTDIMGAFDLAYNYYTYEKKRPRAFRILCFTDGLIESPPGQKFRPWSTFNQDKFRKAGASIGIYFLAETAPGIKANSVRQQVEGATRNLKCVIEEEGEAKDDVKNGTFHLPGLAQ
ncbi:MAG: hypothetical protein M1423_02085, partial [Acidobacteria bacterium]|nr:hypothetical protein [Acidobacteriota bacterium]